MTAQERWDHVRKLCGLDDTPQMRFAFYLGGLYVLEEREDANGSAPSDGTAEAAERAKDDLWAFACGNCEAAKAA